MIAVVVYFEHARQPVVAVRGESPAIDIALLPARGVQLDHQAAR